MKKTADISSDEIHAFGGDDFTPTTENIRISGAAALILEICGTDGIRFAAQFNQARLKEQVRLVAIAAEETWQQALSREELEVIRTNIYLLSSLNQGDT